MTIKSGHSGHARYTVYLKTVSNANACVMRDCVGVDTVDTVKGTTRHARVTEQKRLFL